MHIRTQWLRLLSVLRRWFCCCWFVVDCYWVPIMGFCNCSMVCCALLYVHSSFAIILMGKSEMVSLLSLSSWCLVIVVRLFFVCSLWYFLIILTYFFGVSFMRTLHIWISLEPSSLNQNLTCWLKYLFNTIYASIGGRIWHLLGLVWAFVTIQKPHVVAQMLIECHFVRATKVLASHHICTGLP